MKTPLAKKRKERWWFWEAGQWAALLCCLFLVLLPKGGFKLGPVPITWGYILIAILAVAALPKAIVHPDLLRVKRHVLILFGMMLPFQIVLLIETINGGDTGFILSTIISFIVLPLVFLVLWRFWYSERTLTALLRVMRFCVIAAALYGIFLFFYKILTGHLVEIPYLTVNSADAGLLETTKSIDRGGIFKLISTYNNGNVYGVATLILVPLYDRVETSKTLKLLLRFALLLTLSRTVWAGVLLERLLSLAWLLLIWIRQFPNIKLKVFRRSATNIVLLGSIVAGILVVTAYSAKTAANFSKNFLTDTSLGGRAGSGTALSADALTHFDLITMQPFDGFREMVFLSALTSWGLVGFLTMILSFLAPAAIALMDRDILKNPIRRAALKGMLLYFLVAWVDGAIAFIPVMAFYWLSAIILIYWPPDRMTIQQHSGNAGHGSVLIAANI